MIEGWLPRTLPALVLLVSIGLSLGSFLNVVIHRLPRGVSLLWPPSRCGACGRRIRPWHNVPLLGFLLLGGRCRDCRAPIPIRYPLVEALGGLLTVAAGLAFQDPLDSAVALWMGLSLLVVFWVDLDHRIIPDEISLFGLALGLLLSPWTVGWKDALGGAAFGGGSLLATAWLYEKARGRPGMGMGDVKLAAMLGAFLGLKGVLLTVMLGAFLGSIVGIALLATRRGSAQTALPFGCFLAPAALAAFFFGTRIWAWYLGFFPVPR